MEESLWIKIEPGKKYEPVLLNQGVLEVLVKQGTNPKAYYNARTSIPVKEIIEYY